LTAKISSENNYAHNKRSFPPSLTFVIDSGAFCPVSSQEQRQLPLQTDKMSDHADAYMSPMSYEDIEVEASASGGIDRGGPGGETEVTFDQSILALEDASEVSNLR
jgi:hypothetical protein